MTNPRNTVSPLDIREPIVDPKTGVPTLQFIRLWQQLFLNEDGVFASVDDNATGLDTRVPKTRLINTTAPIAGGGDLSADRTLTHAVSGVAAGAYTAANITVDANGHVTVAANGTAGSLVLLEQHTASTSASLNFTTCISATYDEYLIEFVNIIPATNATKLYMRMSTNAGVSYDSGANYSWHAWGANRFTGGASAGADSGATQIQMHNSASDNTSTAGTIGLARLYSPSSTALHKAVRGSLGFLTSGTVESAEFTGSYRSTTAVDAFQFLMSSGNITSGIIRVYGIAKV